MSSGKNRLRRTVTAVAMAGLLSLATACGAADNTKPTTDMAKPAAGGTATTAPKAGGDVSDQAMKDGCTAVHKLLVALDAGDQATAKTLKDQSKATFDKVVAAAGTKDPQLAANATAMADMTGFDLPAKPVFQSSLAETYTVDCVAQYGAAALPG